MTTTTSTTGSGWELAERRRKAFELALVALRLSDPLTIREWTEMDWTLAKRASGHTNSAGAECRYQAIEMVEQILEAQGQAS